MVKTLDSSAAAPSQRTRLVGSLDELVARATRLAVVVVGPWPSSLPCRPRLNAATLPSMRTLDDAVALLESRGLRGERRKWNLGDTIFCIHAHGETVKGIELFPFALYIVCTDGAWEVADCNRSGPWGTTPCRSLEEACDAVTAALRAHPGPPRHRRVGPRLAPSRERLHYRDPGAGHAARHSRFRLAHSASPVVRDSAIA